MLPDIWITNKVWAQNYAGDLHHVLLMAHITVDLLVLLLSSSDF